MKQIIFSLSILGVIGLSSCVKDSIESPEFNVEIDRTSVNAGDTVRFSITGMPFNLVYYSGEPGNDYYSRDVYTDTGGVSTMRFNTALTAAAGSSTATNLSILVSNNFSGTYSKDKILEATWNDVTNQVTVPGANQAINLDPYKVEGRPIYVAFRFQTVDETKSQRLVTVSNFSVRTVFPSQIYTNASNVYFAGFASFDFAGDSAKTWSIPVTSNTNNSFTHPFVPANSAKDDDWAISKPFYTKAIVPSTGVALKNISSNPVTEHSHVFTQAGTYKVVFVGSNNNNNDYKELVKEFTVTVN